MKRITNLMMMALLTVGMGLTSCVIGEDNPVTPPVTPEDSPEVKPGTDDKGEVTSLIVDLSKIDAKYLDAEKTKLSLTVGDEVTLSFTILPEELADTKVELTAADATILSIDGLKVKALKEGETKVTAKAGEKTAECTVTVKAAEQETQADSLKYEVTAVNKKVGDEAFTNPLTFVGDKADLSFSSSNEAVATVDGKTGEVTIVGAGTAVITVTAADGIKYTYETKTASYTLTVTKTAAAISFTSTEISKTIGDAAFKNETLTIEGDGTVTFESNNENVATIDATSGEVTIVGAGEATITATVTDSDTYTYATKTATYTLTVKNSAGLSNYTWNNE